MFSLHGVKQCYSLSGEGRIDPHWQKIACFFKQKLLSCLKKKQTEKKRNMLYLRPILSSDSIQLYRGTSPTFAGKAEQENSQAYI